MAILADAVSYGCSALLLGSIRTTEQPVVAERRHALHELAEGVRYVFRQPTLRPSQTMKATRLAATRG